MDGPGTRGLLGIDIFRRSCRVLRAHPNLHFVLNGLVAIQGILFHKAQSYNWSLQMHADSVFPARGEGPWTSAGYKEGLPYVHVPRERVAQFVSVRISLDSVHDLSLIHI